MAYYTQATSRIFTGKVSQEQLRSVELVLVWCCRFLLPFIARILCTGPPFFVPPPAPAHPSLVQTPVIVANGFVQLVDRVRRPALSNPSLVQTPVTGMVVAEQNALAICQDALKSSADVTEKHRLSKALDVLLAAVDKVLTAVESTWKCDSFCCFCHQCLL